MRRILFIFGALWAAVFSIKLERKYNPEQPYCFKFTWLGLDPEEANKSKSCSNITTPCFEPITISASGKLPDTNVIWEKEDRSVIGCHMQKGFVCIKYTYTFNDAVQNVSHFCGKMVENKESPIVEGCYTQKVDSHVIEACACTSVAGAVPCNSSEISHPSTAIITLFVILSRIIVGNRS
ncbi:uncharacterized protein LOC107037332 [Diachasma alloeum]|uniref:uncharacterized protein LOC107037332 n=1 Tax=Diachasma alloeum TaxID=454923 RepID=UPI000738328C|nr:uncharacterized protein LOC107037332 [Diachasma alloeum]